LEKEKIDLVKEASSIEDVATQYLDEVKEAEKRIIDATEKIQESKL
jgi:predicted S18 family serine protease